MVRYTIALSLLAFAGLQVLVTGLLRELGAGSGGPRTGARRDRHCARRCRGGPPGLARLCVIAGVAGLTGSADLLGLLVCLAGLAAFQLYYAAARGLGILGVR